MHLILYVYFDLQIFTSHFINKNLWIFPSFYAKLSERKAILKLYFVFILFVIIFAK